MSQIDYVTPTTMEEAIRICAGNPQNTKLIAGGTDLIPQMRNRLANPEVLVDLRLLALDQIEINGDCVSIGAYVTHAQITQSALLHDKFPALTEACNSIGGPATRNRGTVGGNLVNASPAADAVPPLLAYDATVKLCGASYERTVLLSDFYIDYRRTALQPGEILKEINLLVHSKKVSSRFLKMGNRQALTIAVVSTSVCIRLGEDDMVTSARIALGSVAPIPFRAQSAEEVLVNRILDDKTIAKAASEVFTAVSPISDIRASAEYRRKMAEILVSRSLTGIRDDLKKGGNNERN
jgi:CO/xanthine dehydrogenase FAD-binding subunit